jgi:hypothetical protein
MRPKRRRLTPRTIHQLKTPLTNISVRAELTLLEAGDLRAGRQGLESWLTKVEQRMRFIVRATTVAARRCERLFREEAKV